MQILTVVCALFAAWFAHYAWRLWRNHSAARASGLPIVISPVDPDGMPYVMLQQRLRPVFKALLPRAVFDYIKISIYGWEFFDKNGMHSRSRLGPAFMHVTPGSNELWIADPQMATEVLTRRKDFVLVPLSTALISIQGPNVLSSNGDSWQRQRRIIAQNLNERIMRTVWNESRDQAQSMLRYLLDQPDGVTRNTLRGLRTITINVIARAGYGQRQPWTPRPASLVGKESLSYFDSIYLIMSNFLAAAFFPSTVLKLPFMPTAWKLLGKVMDNIPEQTTELLENARLQSGTDSENRQNFMTMLVKLLDDDKSSQTPGSLYLSREEIQGNLFAFTGAGFETTANTLGYAVTALAAFPQWQAWVQEELDRVIPNPSKPVDYEAVFPQLTRCLAIMHETLRHFPPAVNIGRSSNGWQLLSGSNGAHRIAPDTGCYVNCVSIHMDTTLWGEDALEFRPSRWIRQETLGGKDELVIPPRGTFVPWSAGPRVCPGQKMSQVEFTSTLGTLFRVCNVESAPVKGLDEAQLKKRLWGITQDSSPKFTLQMTKPDDVVLKWSPRT